MACAQIDWDNFRFQSQEYRFAVMKSLDVSDEFKDFLYGQVMNGERITRADLWAYGVHNDYWPLFVHEVTTPTNIQDRTQYYEEWVPGKFDDESILRAEEGVNTKKRSADSLRRPSPMTTRSQGRPLQPLTNPLSRPTGLPRPIREGNPGITRGRKTQTRASSLPPQGARNAEETGDPERVWNPLSREDITQEINRALKDNMEDVVGKVIQQVLTHQTESRRDQPRQPDTEQHNRHSSDSEPELVGITRGINQLNTNGRGRSRRDGARRVEVSDNFHVQAGADFEELARPETRGRGVVKIENQVLTSTRESAHQGAAAQNVYFNLPQQNLNHQQGAMMNAPRELGQGHWNVQQNFERRFDNSTDHPNVWRPNPTGQRPYSAQSWRDDAYGPRLFTTPGTNNMFTGNMGPNSLPGGYPQVGNPWQRDSASPYNNYGPNPTNPRFNPFNPPAWQPQGGYPDPWGGPGGRAAGLQQQMYPMPMYNMPGQQQFNGRNNPMQMAYPPYQQWQTYGKPNRSNLSPPEYDGKTPFRFWLSRFENFLMEMRVPPYEYKQSLFTAIQQGAKKHEGNFAITEFLRQAPTAFMSYEDMVRSLDYATRDDTADSQAHKRLLGAYQKPEESIKDWHKRIHGLYLEVLESNTTQGDECARQ